jgi:hypothetical protein
MTNGKGKMKRKENKSEIGKGCGIYQGIGIYILWPNSIALREQAAALILVLFTRKKKVEGESGVKVVLC